MNENTTSRWLAICEHMHKAQNSSPAAARQVQLVAVSKAQPAEAIEALLVCGQRVFGENKVQEAAKKWPALRACYPDIELHLIGSLQSNKAREALELFDVIETIDRLSLVDAIAKARNEGRETRCKKFLVQVNIGEEPQKGGVMPAKLDTLLAYCKQKELTISGLMCVPPADDNPAPYFAMLNTLAQKHNLPELSMGMSGDFETAIRLGATSVRVGTALFGERVKK